VGQRRGGGAALRQSSLIDVFSRESPALRPGIVLSGASVAPSLAHVAKHRPLPKRILAGKGKEITSKGLDDSAYWDKVKFDSSRRGRPGDNAHTRV